MMQSEKHLIRSQELCPFHIQEDQKWTSLLKCGNPNIELPKTHLEGLDFSFSGIKTAVINLNHNKKDIKKEDLCASFEKTVTDMLIQNTKKALEMSNIKKLALAAEFQLLPQFVNASEPLPSVPKAAIVRLLQLRGHLRTGHRISRTIVIICFRA